MLSIHSLFYQTPAIYICIVVCASMVGIYIAGFRLRKRQLKKLHDLDSIGPIEGSMLGLLALILAFTFSMAGQKYDTRKDLLIRETNALTTAIQRADLYPDSTRAAFRKDFKEYLEQRIEYFSLTTSDQKTDSNISKAKKVFNRLWKVTASFVKEHPDSERAPQMIQSLNDMYEIMITREEARTSTIPVSIWFLLFMLTLSATFISGYGTKTSKIDWPLVLGFVCMTAFTIYIILDLDRPTRGLITLSNANEKMMAIRQMLLEE